MLSFSNLEEFLNTLEYFSDSEKGYFTDETLDSWEKQIGFASYRKSYNQLNDDYDQIETEDDLNEFMSNYPNANIADGTLQNIINYSSLEALLNESGNVLIDEALHHFEDSYQIIILDNDLSKLEKTLKNFQSQEEIGIYVFNQKSNEQRNCGTLLECTDLTGSSTGDKRQGVYYELLYFVNPVRDNNSLILYWDMNVTLHANIKQHKKAWYGWIKNHNDDTVWDIGYEVAATFNSPVPFYVSGGTGWTHNQWETDYTKKLFSPHIQSNGPSFPSWYDYKFVHCYNNAFLMEGDNDGNGTEILFCDDDCF